MLSDNDLIYLSSAKIEMIKPEHLKEITEIYIDANEPVEERIEKFFNKISNPYCFLVNGTPVQISYNSHNKTLDECLNNYLSEKKNSDN